MDSLQGSHSLRAIGFSAVRDSGAADATLGKMRASTGQLEVQLVHRRSPHNHGLLMLRSMHAVWRSLVQELVLAVHM
jgi:hypothetical protein